MASISTDTPNGREFTLIAALVCLPFSPKTALINSEAPLIILGWSINSSDEFTDQPKVLNGASELITNVFGESGKHTRAAISVNSLPLGVSVEIDAIFELK